MCNWWCIKLICQLLSYKMMFWLVNDRYPDMFSFHYQAVVKVSEPPFFSLLASAASSFRLHTRRKRCFSEGLFSSFDCYASESLWCPYMEERNGGQGLFSVAFIWSPHVHAGLLPQSKDPWDRWMDDRKLTLGVNMSLPLTQSELN